MTVNENPSVEFRLQVSDSGGFVYEVAHTQIISRLRIPQLQPGATVQVAIDPNDRERLSIV